MWHQLANSDAVCSVDEFHGAAQHCARFQRSTPASARGMPTGVGEAYHRTLLKFLGSSTLWSLESLSFEATLWHGIWRFSLRRGDRIQQVTYGTNWDEESWIGSCAALPRGSRAEHDPAPSSGQVLREWPLVDFEYIVRELLQMGGVMQVASTTGRGLRKRRRATGGEAKHGTRGRRRK